MTVRKVYEPKKKTKASTVLANSDVSKPLAKVLGLMKMGAEHAKKHDPGFAARYDRSLQYLNSKPQEA